ncbi:MAG TPA: MOSC N-terminal beta barrel domain-containing protein [Candidatus Nanopelagicales bacterium]|jgi:uncharacterized protein YcbX|nr:MOSC N-terminal beta barrel domain-containing protein [Candidatus Nanopelagicales bacterium]
MGHPVTTLRRYPVKSMAGEGLAAAEVDPRGITGDRWYAVVDADGRLASGKSSRRFRRRDEVFDHGALTTPSGVRVSCADGDWPVEDAALDRHLSEVMGAQVRVMPEAAVQHQDGGSISLVGTASLRWCEQQLGVDADPRRLRVNLVFESDTPFIEEDWIRSVITAGSARLHVTERIERCRMIDLAQDGVATTAGWLRSLAAERNMCLGVYADVVVPGRIAVGDLVDGHDGASARDARASS